MRSKGTQIRIFHTGNHPEMINIDANKLGRPYHKVPKVFNDKLDQFDSKLSIYFLKKLRVNTSLKKMQFKMDSAVKQAHIFSTELGNIAFRIDRNLLLNILHDYYGLNRESSQQNDNTREPVTKTEERLLSKLALELTSLLCHQDLFSQSLDIKPDHSTLMTQWSYRVDFILDGYSEGCFSLLLDNNHVDHLLAMLRQSTARNNSDHAATHSRVNFGSLPVRLQGRLASLSLTVADLASLQAGDVLPIALPDRIPLYIGDQAPFSAVVCEDRGKLFLSEFTDRMSEPS